MGSRAFWAVVFGFLSGVFVRSFLLVGWSFAVFLMLLATSCMFLCFIDTEKAKRYVFVAIALLSCACGIARMQFATVWGDHELSAELGKSVTIEGIVVQEPDERDTATFLSVRTVDAGILAKLPAHAKVAYGDHIQVSGTLELPDPFDTGNGRQFNYPQYLASQGIEYQLNRARLVSISGNSGEPLQAFAIDVKELFLRGLGTVMPDPEAALAGGITVGDKRSVGPELMNDFQRDSLVHMVVLSGYNITVVLNAVARLLIYFPRYLQFSGSIGVVTFFVFMAGGASSALRAGLMALIATIARATHRVYLGERVLAFASVCMVAWNPWTLCFDPSFQLSALATLGLILFTPIVSGVFATVPSSFGMREILSSTCATQLMVLPLLLYQNGTFSLVALPANLLALLPVPWAMFFSLIAGVGGITLGPSAVALSFPAYALLWYVISVAHVLASLPFAALSIPAFSLWWMFGAYAVLLGVYILYQKGRTAGA